MRVRKRLPLLVVVLLTTPVIAGCLGNDAKDVDVNAHIKFDPNAVIAPGAVLEVNEVGVTAVWNGPIDFDDGARIVIPEGTTMVEAVRTADADDTPTSLAMYNAFTDRIRCQPERFEAYFVSSRGEARCSGVTAVDPLPAVWRTQSRLVLGEGESLAVTLRSDALDGSAAQIDVTQLSMPAYGELATESLMIPASADGADIWLEVTRPDTDDTVPTIIVSSPYNHATRVAGLRPQNSTIADWVPRGYAVVSADVRGFGNSGGCVEVWGPNEQQDQVDVVKWVAEQPWSDGKIGFYGQSYVGTTPLEAASLGAPELDAILIVAPVVNAYMDWHFGGVPNGENNLSPVSYQTTDAGEALGQAPNPNPANPTVPSVPEFYGGPTNAALNYANSVCDPTLAGRASDPRAVYDDFYRERDFAAMAKDVQVPVLYTQGFYDENVKSAMILDWFNALEVPKKGIFGDWVHQHPPRADQELLFHAWFDEHLMGRDTGIMDTPVVEVKTNVDTVRFDAMWPSDVTTERAFGVEPGAYGALVDGAGSGQRDFLAVGAHGVVDQLPTGMTPPESLTMHGEELAERVYISGVPHLRIKATLSGADNVYFYAELRDVDPDGNAQVVSYGMLNAALRNGYETYEPVPPQEELVYMLPFLPTEYVVQAGHHLVLELRSADVNDWAAVAPTEPGIVNVNGDGDDGTALLLPVFESPGDVLAPLTMGPVDPTYRSG